MRGIEIFQKPSYREIRPMRDRPMRGPPVFKIGQLSNVGLISSKNSVWLKMLEIA